MLKLQNKKILYLIFGNEPSSFVRAGVYEEEYLNKNIDAEFFKLFSASLTSILKFFSSIYPIHFFFRILNKLYYFKRCHALLKRVAKYDVVVAVKYIDSKLLKQIKARSNALLIYDFDDAVWLKMFFGNNEFLNKLSIVDCVTSDNSYLANYASAVNKNSYVVNGPCQIEKFIEYKDKSSVSSDSVEKPITLGWIGSPSTLFYLYKIYDALEIIGEKYPDVILKLVGSGNDRLLLPPFEKIKTETIPVYNQDEMIRQVYSFDIGLYPLFLNALSLGRGSLKATIYMSGSKPVICSSIGENLSIIQDGLNGFLADNTDEWVKKLSMLIENPGLRKEVGRNGFNFAKENYSISSCLSRFLHIVDNQMVMRGLS